MDNSNWKKNNNLFKKFLNSLNGFKIALIVEQPIRQEFAASIVLVLLALILQRSTNAVIQVFLLSLVPIAFELINSTLENLIDKSYGTKYNEEVRHMKDMMSASVFVGLLIGYGGALWLLLR